MSETSLFTLSPSSDPWSIFGGSGERIGKAKAASSQQDGHVCHGVCGQVFISFRSCDESRHGLQIYSTSPCPGCPSAGAGGALDLHSGNFPSHARQAQCNRCDIWVNHGLHAIQPGGVLLVVTCQCSCSFFIVELMALSAWTQAIKMNKASYGQQDRWAGPARFLFSGWVGCLGSSHKGCLVLPCFLNVLLGWSMDQPMKLHKPTHSKTSFPCEIRSNTVYIRQLLCQMTDRWVVPHTSQNRSTRVRR